LAISEFQLEMIDICICSEEFVWLDYFNFKVRQKVIGLLSVDDRHLNNEQIIYLKKNEKNKTEKY
jgi:hypothetical protein